MRVAVIQSCYIPWRGYFDIINSVDLFVIYDDVQYSKGAFYNRNQLKSPDGLKWLTVPVKVKGFPKIDDLCVASDSDWLSEHARMIQEFLAEAPYLEDAYAIWKKGTANHSHLLSELNQSLLVECTQYLGISTPIVRSSEYTLAGRATDRLIQLLQQVGATTYVSGPSAKNYLVENQFVEAEIQLEYKTYDYDPYPQLHGDFVGTVSVLDLIANCGPDAANRLTSLSENEVAVRI